MTDFDDDDMAQQGAGLEPTPASLAHWVEEQYQGDDRFEAIEIAEPGPLEGEAVRVMFQCTQQTHFMVAVLEEDLVVRVGLATEDPDLVERIEAATEEYGESLTEFLEVSMHSEVELEHEVQHFHDDVDYYACDLPFQAAEDFAAEVLRDEVIYYLDGFMTSFSEIIGND